MLKQNKILGTIIFLIVVIVGSSCKSIQKTPKMDRNLADIYNPSQAGIHPSFSTFHFNDSSSIVYLRIFPNELMFSEANETGKSLAKISISYKLFEYGTDGIEVIPADSVNIEKTLNQAQERNVFFTALPIKARSGLRYSLQIYIKDELRPMISKTYLLIDKTSPFSRQNFQVLSKKTRYPAFTDNFKTTEKFLIKFNKSGFDSIYVDYFNMDRTLPRPILSLTPDIAMQTSPDSTWKLLFTDSSVFSLDLQGIYMFKMAENSSTGLTLYNFGENFPRIKNTDDLLGPLVYLCSAAEYGDLRRQANRKLAIDNYWLNIANKDMDASRELIRVYYNRVLYANWYFSSYKEGWKTDRGMMYIIFGPPDLLEKNSDEEIWSYRSKRTGTKLEFKFIRNATALSMEDFILDRNSSSSAVWVQAVESWKRGKIYSTEL